MQTIDSKLTQLAAFAGVSISISAGVGGSVLAARHLRLGFAIALGGCLGAAALLLLAGVVIAFSALAPKLYQGVHEADVIARTTPDALNREESETLAVFAASRRDMLIHARSINDRKARATARTFVMIGLGFSALVAALISTVVGSVT